MFQFCICHDTTATALCAELKLDLLNIHHASKTHFFQLTPCTCSHQCTLWDLPSTTTGSACHPPWSLGHSAVWNSDPGRPWHLPVKWTCFIRNTSLIKKVWPHPACWAFWGFRQIYHVCNTLAMQTGLGTLSYNVKTFFWWHVAKQA